MKKILFLLLFTVSFYGQSPILQNPTFGIVTEKNNATDSTPAYFTTSQVDGVHKKTPAALFAKTEAVQDSLDKKLNISDLPTNLTLYPTTTASDVSGYVVMVTDIHDVRYNTTAADVSTPAITTTSQLVSQRISDAGVLIGQPGVFNITTFGNIRHLSGSGTATFFFRVYHRDVAGVETLICTSSTSNPVTNGGYTEFSASGVWNDGTFDATDRIVIKSYANRIAGGSDPVYQFQFGGATPVRTLLPVPFSVVDAGYEMKTNKINAYAVDGSGTKYYTADYINSKLPTSYTKIVYVNATSPNTATIFDLNNPPVTNDNALKLDTANLYIGTDASTWVYNGSTYVTKTVPDTSNFKIYSTGVDAGNNKTSSIYREGSISSNAFVSSNAGMFINRDGSNTAQGGGFMSFSNGVASNSMMFQLNASNGLDLWSYASSTWTKRFTFLNSGALTANSFIKSGGTSTEFLMADGSTSIGGGSTTPIENVLKYFKNYFTDASGLTVNGFTPTFANGKMNLTGGTNDFTKNLTVDNSLNTDENIEIEVIYKATTLGLGLVVGKKSVNGWFPSSIGVHFDMTSLNLKIWEAINISPTNTKAIGNSPVVSPGDIIKLKYTQIGSVVACTATNLTTKETKQTKAISNLSTSINFSPANTGRVCLWNLGGTYDIISIKHTSLSKSNPDIICIGDSKTVGYSSTAQPLRFADNINKLGTVQVFGGTGDRTVEITQTIDGIVLIKPKYAILNIGRNDLASGVASATWQANYSNIVNKLSLAGITVIHLLPIPETTIADQSVLNTWINATYPSGLKIDPSIGWVNGTMLSSDGVHPTEYGHAYISKLIIDSGFITPPSILNVFSKVNEIEPIQNEEVSVKTNFYIDTVNGNDATGVAGDKMKVFKTIDAVLAKITDNTKYYNLYLNSDGIYYINSAIADYFKIAIISDKSVEVSFLNNTNINLNVGNSDLKFLVPNGKIILSSTVSQKFNGIYATVNCNEFYCNYGTGVIFNNVVLDFKSNKTTINRDLALITRVYNIKSSYVCPQTVINGTNVAILTSSDPLNHTYTDLIGTITGTGNIVLASSNGEVKVKDISTTGNTLLTNAYGGIYTTIDFKNSKITGTQINLTNYWVSVLKLTGEINGTSPKIITTGKAGAGGTLILDDFKYNLKDGTISLNDLDLILKNTDLECDTVPFTRLTSGDSIKVYGSNSIKSITPTVVFGGAFTTNVNFLGNLKSNITSLGTTVTVIDDTPTIYP